MESVLTKKQTKTERKDYIGTDGRPATIILHIRYDDSYNTGHNSFSMTADIYTKDMNASEPTVRHDSGATLWMSSCGMQHEAIAQHFPHLAKFLKWHRCSSDGPMHYTGDTVYYANDRDYWGLRKGETEQIYNSTTGLPCWKIEATKKLPEYVDATDCPTETATLRYVPLIWIGKGKARDLDAARKAAVWPEATDEELTAPGLEDRLTARLPTLLAAFKADMEELGFVF